MKTWFLRGMFSLVSGLLVLLVHGAFHRKLLPETIIISASGSQPAVAVDKAGSVHVVFGRENEIFYSQSPNGSQAFAPVQKVAILPAMHLGMTRGPQIAVTNDFVVVANVTKQGRIMVYQRPKKAGKWSSPINLLDTDTTALEGFVALAAGPENTIYAAWLDLRLNRQNNVYSAFSTNGGQTWSENKLVYASPAGKVCECCRPSITADAKGNVYVLFRNNLAGNRDMYLAHSTNSGKSFQPAQKLGLGTWPLKACPMDGGSLVINATGKPVTAWKRQDDIFITHPGLPEEKISAGRNCSLAVATTGNFVVWQQNNTIWAKTPRQSVPISMGAGTYPRAISRGASNMVVWEANGAIVARQVP